MLIRKRGAAYEFEVRTPKGERLRRSFKYKVHGAQWAREVEAGLHTSPPQAPLVSALPGALHPLENWWVIGASAALFCVELFADKVPAFDLVWNALHTFIRVPVAALLAWRATAMLSPQQQLLAALAGAFIAFLAHGGKTAVRAAVTPAPEPFSNIGLSLGEDVLAVSLTWLATTHPLIAAAIAAVLVAILIVLVRWPWRALRALLRAAFSEVSP